MRVLVCGGRAYADRERLWSALFGLHVEQPISCLIHGVGSGADALADAWARAAAVPVQRFPAWWDIQGRAAGPLRNQRMLDRGKPDLVVAFPGGRGTADMVRRANDAGVPVCEVGLGGWR